MTLEPSAEWSDLKVPSSCEWHWTVLASLSVQSSPMVTSVPLRHSAAVVENPAADPGAQLARRIMLMNGVPAKALR